MSPSQRRAASTASTAALPSLDVVTQAILATLSASQRSAWPACRLEQRPKGLGYNLRMPGESPIMDKLWEAVLATCEQHQWPIRRTGIYHSVEEFDDLLGDVQWLWHNWLAMGFLTLLVG